jgi:hypothetical protein
MMVLLHSVSERSGRSGTSEALDGQISGGQILLLFFQSGKGWVEWFRMATGRALQSLQILVTLVVILMLSALLLHVVVPSFELSVFSYSFRFSLLPFFPPQALFFIL